MVDEDKEKKLSKIRITFRAMLGSFVASTYE